MAKRSSYARSSKRIDIASDVPDISDAEMPYIEEEVEEIPEIFREEEGEVEFVRLQLNKEVILTVIGEITGTTYTWNGSGAITNVDKKDADKIIAKMQTYISCCGSVSTPKFSIV